MIQRLGQQVAEPLLLCLTRSVIYARREEKIPEFRGYASALADWGKGERTESSDGENLASTNHLTLPWHAVQPLPIQYTPGY